jgi:hypothetical protein
LVSPSILLLIAAGIIALLAVTAFLSAVLTAQRGRTAAYYSVRRETQQRANRRLIVSLALLLFAGILFAAGFMLPRETSPAALLPAETPAPADTIAASPTQLPASTAAPESTAAITSPIATPALVPTVSSRPTLIPEPTSALDSPLATPTVEPSATPAVVEPNKRLVLRVIASGIDENRQPVGDGTTFQAGTPTLYVFFDYRDVPPDALLRHTWFRDGGSVYYSSQRFNQNGAGLAAIEWSPSGGFKPGLYEVRIQLGGVPQFVANFEVR